MKNNASNKETITYRNDSCAGAAMRHFTENRVWHSIVLGTSDLIVDSSSPNYWACLGEQRRCGWLKGSK